MGFFAWGHHMFVSGQSTFDAGVFGVLSMLVGMFTAIKVFNWVGTMYKGAVDFKTPFAYFCGFLFFTVFGGMTGIAVATTSLDVHWHDTYFVVAHFHFIMVGATVMAFLAALHYWFPKMFGKTYPEGWGLVAAAFIILGFNATFIPQFLLGNTACRGATTSTRSFQALNVASTAGASLLAFGFIIIAIYLTYALATGAASGKNPWRSKGYEWLTESPPPTHNFVGPQPTYPEEPHFYVDAEEGRGARCSLVLTPRAPRPGSPGWRSTSRRWRCRTTRPASGMWLFLSTEILLFAGLFVCYGCYRYLFPEAFAAASRHLDLWLGTTNTVVLITSSLTAALAVHYAKEGKNHLVALMFVLTMPMAVAFLGIKCVEYSHKFAEGALPGQVLPLRGGAAARRADVLHACTSWPPACTPSTSSSA